MCRLNFSDKNMMCDYHLHSEFSFDSSEKIEAICEKAVQSGIREIAITDHAEFPVRDSAPWPDFRRRAEVLDFCRTRFGENLIIRSGVEAGQPWHCDCPGKEWSGENLDFVLASVHELDGYPDPRTYAYTPENTSDFIHTYLSDGNPLPSFEGEPERVGISGDIDAFTDEVWESLNEENKVSLFVRYIDIRTGAYETRIVNKLSASAAAAGEKERT